MLSSTPVHDAAENKSLFSLQPCVGHAAEWAGRILEVCEAAAAAEGFSAVSKMGGHAYRSAVVPWLRGYVENGKHREVPLVPGLSLCPSFTWKSS